ncbi:MAG TPA: glycosyltransferase family 2 protein [Planctomycetaceae bacterium]|nr:glycosyltransferase family 2 protein [Planctomycetaceae bacterium]
MSGPAVLPRSGPDDGTAQPVYLSAGNGTALGVNGARVSIVIAARNNGPFLAATIESALSQTVPCEVIYADDSSIDGSVDLARRFEPAGVKVLPSDVHAGVCETRNRAARAARGDYLVFVDGDDILSPDFVAQHLRAMRPTAPFVYGAARAFGEFSCLWDAPEWEASDLWRHNFVNTSALWNRLAFEASGRWREGILTMWDWDLALRGARLGTPRRSDAVLNYRQHADSWSAGIREKHVEQQTRLFPRFRRLNARLSVGSVVSGRVAKLFPRWMSAVAQSVRLIGTPEPVDLVLLDNTHDPAVRGLLRSEAGRYSATFETVRVLSHPGRIRSSSEPDRRDQTARFMADACNRLRTELRGDIHWLIEDDILVPLAAGAELFHALTDGWAPPHAVTGCYRNRHVPDQYVGGWFRDGQPAELRCLPEEPVAVDLCGTGCLMYWAPRTPRFWDSHLRGIAAHDWEWCLRLKASGGTLLMLPAVRCGHAVDGDRVLGA